MAGMAGILIRMCAALWHIQHPLIHTFKHISTDPLLCSALVFISKLRILTSKKEKQCRWVNLQWNLLSWEIIYIIITAVQVVFEQKLSCLTGLIFATHGCILCQRPWNKTEPGVIDHKQKINMTIGRWKYTVLLLHSWFYVQMAAVSRKLMAFLGSISVLRRIVQDPALKRKGSFF